MPKRTEILSAISRAQKDLDRALTNLATLAVDDRKRVSYSLHALNNYLMVVSTTVQILRKRLASTPDREINRWLDVLRHATHVMMSTARGVLTATAENLPPLLLEPGSLSETVEEVCFAYRDIARSKRVRVSCVLTAKRDYVLTDRVAVGAVLDNLLSNAVKYSAPGGAVSVRTTILGSEVVCSVEDHGPGLSEEDQAHLFERGTRLSSQPTGGEASTGYGLAVAKDLAGALGGRLWCTSVLGEGSCFLFALPLASIDDTLPIGRLATISTQTSTAPFG